jgi:MOSC domain-containing protein YiiM
MSELAERLRRVPQRGEITWIGLRPGHDDPMTQPERVRVIAGRGLEGDRASRASRGGKRQVTLIQAEHLPVIASLVGRTALEPALLRRNLVVRGVNLVSLKGLRFRIGAEVVLLGTGPCEPCSKMDRALGDGGFHAMRGHGGITTRVLHGGVIHVGDAVWVDDTFASDTDELE